MSQQKAQTVCQNKDKQPYSQVIFSSTSSTIYANCLQCLPSCIACPKDFRQDDHQQNQNVIQRSLELVCQKGVETTGKDVSLFQRLINQQKNGLQTTFQSQKCQYKTYSAAEDLKTEKKSIIKRCRIKWGNAVTNESQLINDKHTRTPNFQKFYQEVEGRLSLICLGGNRVKINKQQRNPSSLNVQKEEAVNKIGVKQVQKRQNIQQLHDISLCKQFSFKKECKDQSEGRNPKIPLANSKPNNQNQDKKSANILKPLIQNSIYRSSQSRNKKSINLSNFERGEHYANNQEQVKTDSLVMKKTICQNQKAKNYPAESEFTNSKGKDQFASQSLNYTLTSTQINNSQIFPNHNNSFYENSTRNILNKLENQYHVQENLSTTPTAKNKNLLIRSCFLNKPSPKPTMPDSSKHTKNSQIFESKTSFEKQSFPNQKIPMPRISSPQYSNANKYNLHKGSLDSFQIQQQIKKQSQSMINDKATVDTRNRQIRTRRNLLQQFQSRSVNQDDQLQMTLMLKDEELESLKQQLQRYKKLQQRLKNQLSQYGQNQQIQAAKQTKGNYIPNFFKAKASENYQKYNQSNSQIELIDNVAKFNQKCKDTSGFLYFTFLLIMLVKTMHE